MLLANELKPKSCNELVEHEYALRKYETTKQNKKTRSNFSRHRIRVRIPSSKFSSLKMCHNARVIMLQKVALGRTYELYTILLPLARANDASGRQWVIDTHARVVVSKLNDDTQKPTKKISTWTKKHEF